MGNPQTVFIVGATGKTGQSIVNALLGNPDFVSYHALSLTLKFQT